MMNEYQITFFVNDASHARLIAVPISRLEKKFKSVISLINITRNQHVDLCKSIGVYQAGLQQGDLCQITAMGVDAELVCFVLKDLIEEHFVVVGANVHLSLSQMNLPCDITWHYAKAHTELTKFDCLKGLAQLIYPSDPDELVLSFVKREEYSATGVTSGIALPHVMFEHIDRIAMAVIATNTPVDWQSPLGEVNFIIGLVMPMRPSLSQIVAATNMTRNLLIEPMSERLLCTRSHADLHAILLYATSRSLR